MNSSQLINANSSDVEYYTDPRIIAAATLALGGTISLDPASSELANKKVGALRWFGIEANGLDREWGANTIWLNWPFGRAEKPCSPNCDKKHVHHSYELFGNQAWSDKLISEWNAGNFEEGCAITYACTSEAWFQPLADFPKCWLAPRTNYYLPDGTLKVGVTKGSCVHYFGYNLNRFVAAFRSFGKITQAVK